MNCDRVRQNLYQDPRALERIRLRLHLLRCPACRAEARQVRALDTLLTELPRLTPSRELLPKVLALSRSTGRALAVRAVRKERKRMRRLIYGAGLLAVLGVLGGLLTQRQPDPLALLISAAQAMEEAETILVRTTSRDVRSERWYSPAGFREEYRNLDGTLKWVLCGDVASGKVRRCMTWSQVVLTYSVDSEALNTLLLVMRRNHLNGELMAEEQARQYASSDITSWPSMRNGREILTVDVAIGGALESGQPAVTTEYDIDPANGRMLAFRTYMTTGQRKTLHTEAQVTYGRTMPSTALQYNPPDDYAEEEGHFRILEDGYIHFGVPGDGTGENVENQDSGAVSGGGGAG